MISIVIVLHNVNVFHSNDLPCSSQMKITTLSSTLSNMSSKPKLNLVLQYNYLKICLRVQALKPKKLTAIDLFNTDRNDHKTIDSS